MNLHSSGAKSPRRLKDRFREETAEAVLGAAEQLFAQQGLHGASMAQIAERAGVAVGTLYNHFKDRETLLVALLDQRHGELLGRLDEALAQTSREPFARQLRGFLGILFEYFEEHRAFLLIVFEHGAWKKCQETPRALHDRIESLLRRGHREKVLRPDQHQSFAVVLLGAVRATFLREKYGAEPLPASEAVEAVADFFLRGASK
jgi:AcrR family transcriptional regulator